MSFSYDASIGDTARYGSTGAIAAIALIPGMLALLFYSVCMVLVFRKAGFAGWQVFVPVYNTYCTFRIVGIGIGSMLLLLVPIVNFIVLVRYSYRLFRCFGMSVGASIIFLIFGCVGLPILAFSKRYQYEGIV